MKAAQIIEPNEPLRINDIEKSKPQGNQVLENWQVTHFRLLGNDAFLPYGSSVLESARRIWRQLILIEDAMLFYSFFYYTLSYYLLQSDGIAYLLNVLQLYLMMSFLIDFEPSILSSNSAEPFQHL